MLLSKILISSMAVGAAIGASMQVHAESADKLAFNSAESRQATLSMPSGETVNYTAYENIFYVTNIEDSVYQTLNIYVPDKLKSGESTPIFLRTYIGGYMATTAKSPSATDATGRALKEGCVVCIPGSRGANSTITRDGKTIYTGMCCVREFYYGTFITDAARHRSRLCNECQYCPYTSHLSASHPWKRSCA